MKRYTLLKKLRLKCAAQLRKAIAAGNVVNQPSDL